MENNPNVPNHQPGGEGMTKYQDIPILQGVFRTGKAEKDVQQIQVWYGTPFVNFMSCEKVRAVEDGFEGSLDWILGCPHIFVATIFQRWPGVLKTLTVRLTYLAFAKKMVTLNPMDSINQY